MALHVNDSGSKAVNTIIAVPCADESYAKATRKPPLLDISINGLLCPYDEDQD